MRLKSNPALSGYQVWLSISIIKWLRLGCQKEWCKKIQEINFLWEVMSRCSHVSCQSCEIPIHPDSLFLSPFFLSFLMSESHMTYIFPVNFFLQKQKNKSKVWNTHVYNLIIHYCNTKTLFRGIKYLPHWWTSILQNCMNTDAISVTGDINMLEEHYDMHPSS